MHPSELGPGVALFDALDVRFYEVPGPELSRELTSSMDRAWDKMVRANPILFDGPVALCSDIREFSTRLEVRWSRATYRYRTVRQIPGAPALSSIFVGVLQPTTDGRLLVGHMSDSTSSPGVIQLPGGNLEPAPAGEQLTTRTLQDHAAAELAEETGIDALPGDLTLWVTVRTSNGNVGFFYLAPSLPAEVIIDRHASVVLGDRRKGREPEFDRIALVANATDLAELGAPSADYLQPLLDRRHLTYPLRAR